MVEPRAVAVDESSASVSGGRNNIASGYGASVGGGQVSLAEGNYSSVFGGYEVKAKGEDEACGGDPTVNC